MKLTLFSDKEFISVILPEKIGGRHWLKIKDSLGKLSNIVVVEAEYLEGNRENVVWALKSNRRFSVINSENMPVASLKLRNDSVYKILSKDNKKTYVLHVEAHEDGQKIHLAYKVKNGVDKLSIGSQQSNDIIYQNKLVSGKHAEIIFTNAGNYVKDTGSKNKLYVNGRVTKGEKIKNWDVIYIMGMQIVVSDKLIFINNPNQNVLININKLEKYKTGTSILPMHEIDEEDDDETDENIYYYREPRFKYGVDVFEFRLDPPPSAQNADEMPLMMLLGPSITMGMASLASGVFAFSSAIGRGDITSAMPSLVMSMSMLLGTLMWPMLTKRFQRKAKKKKEEDRQREYRNYLLEAEKTILEEMNRQEKILKINDVNFATYMNRILKEKPVLWERTPKHEDFLSLRLGHGDMPFKASIQYNERKFSVENDDLLEEMYKFGEKERILKGVPICLSLLNRFISGVYANKNELLEFAKNIILQISTLHSYDEVKLVLICNESDYSNFSFVKFLPHVMNNEKTVRYIATNSDEAKNLSYELDSIIESRKAIGESKLQDVQPHFVVLCLDKLLSAKAECVRRILENKSSLKFSVISMFENLGDLPKECSAVMEIINIHDNKLTLIDDVSSSPLEFKADIYDTSGIDEAAQVLANTEIDITGFNYTLPKKYSFFEMFGVGMPEHLNILDNWINNDPTKSLAATVGIDRFAEPFKLDLHENAHGPHGLVAGMTGSGKSEFIITYILSMAVNYHPCEVAFILIDYKGGGMAKSFENIPHTAGIITNLDGNGIKRSLISMKSELHRRELIFRKVSEQSSISNIDIYKYQKLFREGKVAEPLPHLLIISDEFAELKKEQPDFMQELTSTARVGRSLGVHLILATQKPGGVVDDQIRSNSRFKVCLKVQDSGDSMEMLGKSDAATLVDTGRFYLQVGYNEIFEMGQSAWAGAPYYPSSTVIKDKDDAVSIINKNGQVISEANIDRFAMIKDPQKQLDIITSYINKISSDEKIHRWKMWLDPLSDIMFSDELEKKYKASFDKDFVINPIVGEYDDPMNQKQGLLTVPITKEGNVIVYGSTGNGKAMFIESMCYSLIKNYTPQNVNVYILDFGSETLTSLKKAPHVGDVILSYQTEKVDNLINYLFKEIEERKNILSKFGGDFLYYNNSQEKTMPNIVVMINNYAIFTELYEEKLSEINFLTREGTKYGIYFVLTCTGVNAVRFNMLQNFKLTYCLQLNNPDDYSTVVGRTEGMAPSKFKGRGIFRSSESSLLEFQIARLTSEESQFKFLSDFSENVKLKFRGKAAKKISVLPEKISIENLLEQSENISIKNIPIAMNKASLDTAYVDVKESVINLMLSLNKEWQRPIDCMANITSNHCDIKTIVIDPTDSIALEKTSNLEIFKSKEECVNAILNIFELILTRNNEYKNAVEKGDKLPDFKQVLVIIKSLSELKFMVENGVNQDLFKPETEDDTLMYRLSLAMSKCEKEYNINFVIGENVSTLTPFTIESWYKSKFNDNSGIWIGSGANSQYRLAIKNRPESFSSQLSEDFGYIVKNTQASLVKFVQ